MKLSEVLKPKSKEEIIKLLKDSAIHISCEYIDVTTLPDNTHKEIKVMKYYINGVEHDYSLIQKYIHI